MKPSILTIVFLFIFSSLLTGQGFSIEGLLNTSFNDPLVLDIYDQSEYLKTIDMRKPNVNEVEIRSRSEDANLSPDDFRLRFSLTNFAEIREGNRYNDLLIQNYDLEYNVRFQVALVYRYSLALDYLKITSELKLVEKQKLNLEDQIKVEKADILNGKGDINDLSKMERDYTSCLVEESELRNRLAIQEGRIRNYYSFEGQVVFPEDSLIQLQEIKEFIDSGKTGINPELVLKEQELHLDLQETELEKKESWGDLGFIQAEYERNPNQPFSEKLGYQLGFTLPITNPDKAKIEQSKLKNLRKQQSYNYLIGKKELEIGILEKNLKELIDHYNYLEQRYKDAIQQYISLKGKYLDIGSMLVVQENELRLEETLIDQRSKIYSSYLDWLDETGAVSQLPLKNYIFSGFPVINH